MNNFNDDQQWMKVTPSGSKGSKTRLSCQNKPNLRHKWAHASKTRHDMKKNFFQSISQTPFFNFYYDHQPLKTKLKCLKRPNRAKKWHFPDFAN